MESGRSAGSGSVLAAMAALAQADAHTSVLTALPAAARGRLLGEEASSNCETCCHCMEALLDPALPFNIALFDRVVDIFYDPTNHQVRILRRKCMLPANVPRKP